jgi:lysophospholipase L1-like esterase
VPRSFQRVVVLLLGVLVLVLGLEIGLRALAIGFAVRQRGFDGRALGGDDELVVLCIGESTTAMGGMESWPAQLERMLQERLPGRRVVVHNRGVPGVDSSVLMGSIEHQIEQLQPDIIAAMMGANDVYSGAIPYEQVPMAERGLLGELKTLKLVRQLLHQRATHSNEGDVYGPLMTRRWSWSEGYGLEQSPGGAQDRIAVGRARLAARDGDMEQAEAVLRAALRARPDTPLLLEELGTVLYTGGRPELGLASLERAATLAPESASIQMELAGVHCTLSMEGDARTSALHRAEVEQHLLEAARLAPDSLIPLLRLVDLYRGSARPAQALARAEQAAAMADPPPERLVHQLVGLYHLHRRHEDVLAVYEGSGQGPYLCAAGDEPLYVLQSYEALGRQAEADALLEQLERSCLERGGFPDWLADLLQQRGEQARFAALERRRSATAGSQYCPLTHRSFEQLGALSAEHGILLVAVQYPRRPVEALERYVQARPGLVLVDSQDVFEEAVAERGFEAIFEDRCYGDIGHGTPAGNGLLAAQVASAITQAL